MKPLKLSRTESVLGVIAQFASGPGWINEPTFVIIGDAATGGYRHACIQPEDRSPRLTDIWRIAATAQDELMRCITTTKET